VFYAPLRRSTARGLVFLLSITGSLSSVRAQSSALDQRALRFAITELEEMQANGTRESAVSVSDGRRAGLAKKILEADPYNAVALEEMGREHAAIYRWYANFDATKQPLGDGVLNRAGVEFDLAGRFLKESLVSDPSRISALGELVRLYAEEGLWADADEACRQAARDNKDRFEPWLYRGLVAQLQNQSEVAMEWFDRAIDAMPDNLRSVFTGTPAFVDDSTKSATEYWEQRDPWRVTATNERLADHYARLAYSELWYGGGGVRGWNTERGMVVLRYGIPWSDASYTSGYSRFNELAYRDFEFVFEDIVRGGHFTMYSPKASQSSSWKNDYVIQAAEMAISKPELYDPKSLKPVNLDIRPLSFRGDSGRVDVYVQVIADFGDTTKPVAGLIGAFLVDSTGHTLDSSTRSTPNAMQGNASSTLFKLSSGRPIDRLEVEFLSLDRTSAGRSERATSPQSFHADSLSISDLVIASDIESGSGASLDDGYIVRSGYTIRPATASQHTAGEDLLVFFELYGLTVDEQGRSHFHVEAKLARAESRTGVSRFVSRIFSGSDTEPVSVSVDSDGDDSDLPRFISLAIPPQTTGRFNLSLEVTDLQTGRRTVKQRPVELRLETP